MRFKFTLILLLLNLVLFFGIKKYDDLNLVKNTEKSSNTIGFYVNDINKIQIQSKQWREPYVLLKQGKDWKLEQPLEWPANLFAVQRIITHLQFLKPEVSFSVDEVLSSGQSLADYGLDHPNVEITFWSGSEKQSLKIGKSTNIGNRVYALNPNHNQILVIKEDLLETLSSKLENLRNPQIFNIPLFDLNALSIDVLRPHHLRMKLLKNQGQWEFISPIQANANNTLVNNSINQLSALTVTHFFGEQESQQMHTGLESPSMRLVLESKDREQVLLIGASADAEKSLFYAKLSNNPTVFTVSVDSLSTLKDAQEALRDKQILKINPENITNVEISQNDAVVKLQQLEDNSWQLLDRNLDGSLLILPADSEVVTLLFGRMRALEAVTFISDAPSDADLINFGLKDPQRVIAFSGNQQTKLVVGNIDKESGHLYAKLENSPCVYLIPAYVLSMTPVSTLFYQERQLTQLPKGAVVTGLSLRNLQSNEVIFNKQLPSITSKWELLLNDLPENKKIAVSQMLQNVKNFQVAEFIQRSFADKVELDAQTTVPWMFKLEVNVALADTQGAQQELMEFYFTKRLGGSLQIGGSPKDGMLFNLKQNWIDDLFPFQKSES